MKLSARNALQGIVKAIEHGSVNSEVTIELPDGQTLVAVITKVSAQNLGLNAGKKVYAVIKASNVIVATD